MFMRLIESELFYNAVSFAPAAFHNGIKSRKKVKPADLPPALLYTNITVNELLKIVFCKFGNWIGKSIYILFAYCINRRFKRKNIFVKSEISAVFQYLSHKFCRRGSPGSVLYKRNFSVLQIMRRDFP